MVDRAPQRRAQQADLDKVVEVASLQRRILPVVREAEELAFLFGNSAVVPGTN